MGDIHVNMTEGFWSLAKNGIQGAFHSMMHNTGYGDQLNGGCRSPKTDHVDQ